MTVTTVTRNVQLGITASNRFFGLYENSERAKTSLVDVGGGGWSLRPSTECTDSRAVVVSDAFDESILNKLLAKYGLVTVTELKSYLDYTVTNSSLVSGLIHDLRRNRGNLPNEISASEYIEALGRLSSIGQAPKPYNSGGPEDTSVVYFIGAPDMPLASWNKYTANAALTMYVQLDDGVQEIELVDLADVCTRHEILQSSGCLACPHRANCTQHLLQANAEPIHVTLASLKKTVARLGVPLIPHSDCRNSRRFVSSNRLDIRSISLEGALETHRKSVNRREAIKKNVEFFRNNCSRCSLRPLCGTAKSLDKSGKGVMDYCAGKVQGAELEVTVDNYTKVLEVVISSLLVVAARRAELVYPAVELVREWVETECSVPGHAAYFIPKMNKYRSSNGDRPQNVHYVVPPQLIELAKLFDLHGSFDTLSRSSYDHGIGRWLYDATRSIASLVPGGKPLSGWVAIATQHVHIEKHQWPQWPRNEYVATEVLHSVLGAKQRRSSKVYSTKESRLQLAVEFIAQFLSPMVTVWYGPFGSSKAWVSQGIPGRWQYSYVDRTYKTMASAFPVKSPTENVVTILEMLRRVDPGSYKLLENNNRLKEIVNG